MVSWGRMGNLMIWGVQNRNSQKRWWWQPDLYVLDEVSIWFFIQFYSSLVCNQSERQQAISRAKVRITQDVCKRLDPISGENSQHHFEKLSRQPTNQPTMGPQIMFPPEPQSPNFQNKKGGPFPLWAKNEIEKEMQTFDSIKRRTFLWCLCIWRIWDWSNKPWCAMKKKALWQPGAKYGWDREARERALRLWSEWVVRQANIPAVGSAGAKALWQGGELCVWGIERKPVLLEDSEWPPQ